MANFEKWTCNKLTSKKKRSHASVDLSKYQDGSIFNESAEKMLGPVNFGVDGVRR
jgi:hypothetical protein